MVKTQTDRLSHVIDILLEMTGLQSAEKADHISLAELTEEVICDLEAVGDKNGICIYPEVRRCSYYRQRYPDLQSDLQSA